MQSNNTVYTGKASKGEFLDRLVANRTLTSDGKEWLTTALDPFHDYNHQISGYPDADVAQTNVACYQYELPIAKPANVAAGLTWDCHVMTLPLMTAAACCTYNQSADWSRITDTPLPAFFPVGPLSVITGPAGTPLTWPAAIAGTNMEFNCLPQTGVEDLSSGVSRVIAMGFEVHNTTAEISKQGSVTTYRMPQTKAANQSLWSNAAGTSYGMVNGLRFNMPPTSTANANLLKGTRTWEAKDGCYATCFQSTVTNPLLKMANTHGLFDPTADPGNVAVVLGTPLLAGLPAVDPKSYVPVSTQFMPFDTTGAIFTGLSSATTLMIKLRVYVERAPTWSEPSLAVLASPSAGYDVQALELYAQAINMLPAAVKVNENAAGDWWRGVLNILRHVAAPLGVAMNSVVPGAGLVGGAVSTLLGQLNTQRSISGQSAARAKELKPAVSAPPPRVTDRRSQNKSKAVRRPGGTKPRGFA